MEFRYKLTQATSSEILFGHGMAWLPLGCSAGVAAAISHSLTLSLVFCHQHSAVAILQKAKQRAMAAASASADCHIFIAILQRRLRAQRALAELERKRERVLTHAFLCVRGEGPYFELDNVPCLHTKFMICIFKLKLNQTPEPFARYVCHKDMNSTLTNLKNSTTYKILLIR